MRWPFYLGDALMVGAAYFIYTQSKPQMTVWEMGLMVLCIAAGSVLGIAPWVLEYRALVRLTEVESLSTVVAQIQKVEALAVQIREASGSWYTVQEQANKTAAAAEAITERMTNEVRAFTEFLQRANDSEKATLRLEVDKLRRGEAEWVQVLVRILDHVYALHQAAVRSGQAKVIEQIGHFQDACRDATRRVGLSPFTAKESEPFNPERHQAVEGDGQATAGAHVRETVATGYTFQGRLVRPALVRLGDQAGDTGAGEPVPNLPERSDAGQTDAPAQAHLPLGGTGSNAS